MRSGGSAALPYPRRGGFHGPSRAARLLLALLPALPPVASCGHDASRVFPSRTIGQRGAGPGAFFRPRGVACGGDGRIYAVDMTGRIQAFSPEGVHLRTFRMPEILKGKPTNLGVCRDGHLLVPDTHYSRVMEFDPDGRCVRIFGREGCGPGEFGLVTDAEEAPDGTILVLDYGGCTAEGEALDRVQRFTREGRFIALFGRHGAAPGEFQRPMGLAVSPSGEIYVADSANHRVQRFAADGRFLAAYGRPGTGPGCLRYPYDVALDPEGNLYVLEYSNQRIQKFDPNGHPLGTAGVLGREPGGFVNPRGIAYNGRGTLLVADTDNHRLQAVPLDAFP